MTFNDLPKQQRLLIYMFYYEAESGKAITMSKNGDDIIAYGISKNKNSLANMLYTLRKKGFVTETILRNGEVAYRLTAAGQDSARHFINLCGNDIEVHEAKDSLQETEEQCCDIAAYAKRLEQIVVGLKDELFRLNGQPKRFDGLVKAQAKEIERLKTQIKRLETENDSLRVSKKIVRDAALYFDEEKTALRNERDNLKRSLSSALADLDRKNKKIDHLEDSIDKLKVNLAKMAEWAGQLKNGAN